MKKSLSYCWSFDEIFTVEVLANSDKSKVIKCGFKAWIQHDALNLNVRVNHALLVDGIYCFRNFINKKLVDILEARKKEEPFVIEPICTFDASGKAMI